jgi:HD-GYP domain-containing protein (c-di-GMP phosphodiesterase class II)
VNSRSGKVMDFALAIGEELGLSSDELEQLRFAGLLHDVGSAGLVEEIVLRPRQLTPDEIVVGEQRLEMGSSVLEQIDFLKSLTPIVLHHHEQWDGSGWPQGLVGTAIPLPARVLAVADEYDALTTGRGRSRRLSPVQARGAIAKDSGTRFDPQAVVALFAVLERMVLAGSTGLLAGESAHGRAELPA